MSDINNISALTAEEAAPYLPCFEDAYWANERDGPYVFDPRRGDEQISYQGKRLLSGLRAMNDGMLRLGKPSVVEDQLLWASSVSNGTIVKLIVESIEVGSTTSDVGTEEVNLMFKDHSGFQVIRAADGIIYKYTRTAKWVVAAENKAKGLTFFEMAVDYESSFDAGPYSHQSNMVFIKSDDELSAHPLVVLRHTDIPMPNLFRRIATAMTYKPLVTPPVRMTMHRRGFTG